MFPSIDKAADYSYTKLTNLGEPDTCMSIIQMQFKVHCNFRISFLIYVQICFNHKGWIHSDIICILKGVGGGGEISISLLYLSLGRGGGVRE